ncbi:MAG: NAD(P)H-quinone oxidoreductase [Burkholderiaceae bacterium]|jgi:NADPH2:quinone reductase
MQAIVITAFGEAEGMVMRQLPLPRPQAGEVLIKVAACGVNRPDVLQRQGLYPPPASARSGRLGLEVSGNVVELGADVSNLQCGDEVCALVDGGGYAEYVVASQELCLPIPSGVDLIDAAGLPEVYMTVWSNIFERCRLQAGETLLVHGGAGGIGTAAVQLAKALGASVLATVGSKQKETFLFSLGVDAVFIRTEGDWVAQAIEYTKNKGVDVVLEMAAGSELSKSIACLATDGRLAVIGLLGGAKSTIDVSKILLRRLTLTGSTLRARPLSYKKRIVESLKTQVWPLFARGLIRPITQARFSLGAVVEAHRLMESNTHTGKIILTL